MKPDRKTYSSPNLENPKPLNTSDINAFLEDVYEKYGTLMRGIALRITGDWQDAEEVVNESLLSLCCQIKNGKINNESQLEAAIATIAKSRGIDNVRSSRRWNQNTELSDRYSRPGFEEQTVNNIVLDEAIGSLPDNQRRIIKLRYGIGLNNDQTAEVLDVAPGTVKSRTRRALNKLRKLI